LTNEKYYSIIDISGGVKDMKRCTNCGREFTSESMKFCIVCGSKLTDQAAETAEAVKTSEAVKTAEAVEAVEAAEAVKAEADETETVEAEIVEADVVEADEAEAVEIETVETDVIEADEAETVEAEIVDTETVETEIVETEEKDDIKTETDTNEKNSYIAEKIHDETEVIEVAVVPRRHKKPKSILRKVVNGLLSAIFCILAFSLLIAAGTSFIARTLTNHETIDAIISSVDVLNLPVTGTPMASSGKTVGEAIYVMADGTGLSEEGIEEIIEEATFKDELISVLSDYGDFIRTGNTADIITTDDLKRIYDDNLAVINRVIERAGGDNIDEGDAAIAHAAIDSAEPVLDRKSVV
jgi:hypothetical protein